MDEFEGVIAGLIPGQVIILRVGLTSDICEPRLTAVRVRGSILKVDDLEYYVDIVVSEQ